MQTKPLTLWMAFWSISFILCLITQLYVLYNVSGNVIMIILNTQLIISTLMLMFGLTSYYVKVFYMMEKIDFITIVILSLGMSVFISGMYNVYSEPILVLGGGVCILLCFIALFYNPDDNTKEESVC